MTDLQETKNLGYMLNSTKSRTMTCGLWENRLDVTAQNKILAQFHDYFVLHMVQWKLLVVSRVRHRKFSETIIWKFNHKH